MTTVRSIDGVHVLKAAAKSGWMWTCWDDVPFEYKLVKQSEIAEPSAKFGQREKNEDWLNKTSKDYNPMLMGALAVVKIIGEQKLHPLDGGGRKYLAERMNPDSLVACQIYKKPMTLLEYNDLMVDLNRKRRPFGKLAIFHSRAVGGHEEEVLILEVVTKHGFTIGSGRGRPNNISSADCLYECMKDGGRDRLDMALGVIREAYNGSKNSLNGVFIGGVSHFLGENGSKIERPRLVRVLKDHIATADVCSDAKNRVKEFKSKISGNKKSRAGKVVRSDAYSLVSKNIKTAYNSALPESLKKTLRLK